MMGNLGGLKELMEAKAKIYKLPKGKIADEDLVMPMILAKLKQEFPESVIRMAVVDMTKKQLSVSFYRTRICSQHISDHREVIGEKNLFSKNGKCQNVIFFIVSESGNHPIQ